MVPGGVLPSNLNVEDVFHFVCYIWPTRVLYLAKGDEKGMAIPRGAGRRRESRARRAMPLLIITFTLNLDMNSMAEEFLICCV